MKKFLVACACLLCLCGVVQAADVDLRWDVVEGAIGYYVFMSTDSGQSWSSPKITAVNQYTWVDAPDHGLVLWRVAAFNAQGSVLRTEAGAWFNGDWTLPSNVSAAGVK